MTDKTLPQYEVTTMPLADLKDHPNNPRTISKEALGGLAKSIETFGLIEPIIWNRRTGYIVGGHQRKKAIEAAGYATAQVLVVDFDPEKEMMANLSLNNPKIQEEFTENTEELLSQMQIADPDFFRDSLLMDLRSELFPAKDEKYTGKIESPIYTPTGPCPTLGELCNRNKATQLITEIDAAPIPDTIKDFLRAAAQRHVVFDYQSIAEYYAHAPKEVQDLMEKSALVIIDYKKAIANGFVEMTNEIAALFPES